MMKIFKYFTILMVVFGLFNMVFSEERVKPKPMKELTQPSSPSYVPYPFPKNHKEIVVDLKYALKKLLGDDGERGFVGKIPRIRKILMELVEDDSRYRVEKAVKVKNRLHRVAHDYSWLIFIMDENNNLAARIVMEATGLFGGAAPIGPADAERYQSTYPESKRGPHRITTEQDVIDRLTEEMETPVDQSDIIKMERVAFPSVLSDHWFPLWEIKLKKGKLLYYSVKNDTVYEVEKKVPWKRGAKGYRLTPLSVVKTYDALPDTINDEILVLRSYRKER